MPRQRDEPVDAVVNLSIRLGGGRSYNGSGPTLEAAIEQLLEDVDRANRQTAADARSLPNVLRRDGQA